MGPCGNFTINLSVRFQDYFVSFEARNLCTFLLCLFQSIISSLVNDYYLISFFYFNQFHLNTRTKYCVSYFILSAIHVRSAIGDFIYNH